jgi:hypothetical protein
MRAYVQLALLNKFNETDHFDIGKLRTIVFEVKFRTDLNIKILWMSAKCVY